MALIKPKEKPCKGTGKAKGYGCGSLTLYRKNGLCPECQRLFNKWWYNTQNSSKDMQYLLKKAKVIVSTDEKKERKKHQLELISVDKYRSEYVQPIINEIARLIDYGQPCIATGHFGKMNGGHYHAVGTNRTISLHLDNIHIQSFHSNHFKSGDNKKYREGLVRVYGEEYANYVDSLNSIPAIHLSKNDLIEIKEKASSIRSRLKKDLKIRTPDERIELRIKINEELGIYKRDNNQAIRIGISQALL